MDINNRRGRKKRRPFFNWFYLAMLLLLALAALVWYRYHLELQELENRKKSPDLLHRVFPHPIHPSTYTAQQSIAKTKTNDT